ncbi:hypothetical protein F5Y05DRAFT_381335 [Hypoxylon sp. FL0543]|nr:hypothetical protein F5Y05DRAFT_381335 [Hypoxylon sp. FL0543]
MTMFTLPEHLPKAEAVKYLEDNSESLKEYLGARIPYFEDVGYFFNAFGYDDAYLVVILAEGCPLRPNGETRNWSLDDLIVRALTDNRPLPSQPEHTIYTMFADYVVVRKDEAAESGYSVVSWPVWIKTAAGEYGGDKLEKEEEKKGD